MWSGGLGDKVRRLSHCTEIHITLNSCQCHCSPNTIHVFDHSPIHTNHVVRKQLGQYPEILVINWPRKGCDMKLPEYVWVITVRIWDVGDMTSASIENHASAEWKTLKHRLHHYQ